MANVVLLTRPMTDCVDIQGYLEGKGYEVICEPFIKIIPHDVVLPDFDDYAGMIATSANALKILPQDHYGCPIYCVGTQTSEAAKALGFQDVVNIDGNVAALAAVMKELPTEKPFLYLRGRDVSQELGELLPNHHLEGIITYHVDKIDKIIAETVLRIINGEVNKVLFFSTRTAEAFADWALHHPDKDGVESGLKQTQALCLGESMVESLSDIKWQNIAIAARPTRESLLDLL